MSWGNKTRMGKDALAIEQKHFDALSKGIKTISEDDPEYAAIAAQCTPPKDIITKHGLGKPLIGAEGRDKRYRYRSAEEPKIT